MEIRLQVYPSVFLDGLRQGNMVELVQQFHNTMEHNAAYVDGVLSKVLTGSDLSQYAIRIHGCLTQIGYLKAELQKAKMGLRMSMVRCVASMTFLEAYLKGLVYTVQDYEEQRGSAA